MTPTNAEPDLGEGEMKGRKGPSVSRGWTVAGAAIVALLLPLTACNFEVTNPGPVQDKFLDGPLAYDGIVAGVKRALLDAHFDTDRNGASGVREIFPAGNVGNKGVDNSPRVGIYDQTVTNSWWNSSSNARWLAENAVARLKASLGAAYPTSINAGTANLFAGYANRHLGETFCEAVIDGGPILPFTEFLNRADTLFTNALAIFTAANNASLKNAALAGRASVRADLNNWTGAMADAALVPTSLKYVLEYFNLEDLQFNSWVSASGYFGPFRTISTWNTFYETYFQQTGDPRTPWETVAGVPFGSAQVAPYGNIPWYRERKYTTGEDDQNLSTGREMRLLEAENQLRLGNFAAAMTIINANRTSVNAITIAGITNAGVVAGTPLQPWTPAPTTLIEAGTAYKKESGIELWLEGRRMGARSRWARQNLPGDLTVYEVPSTTAPVHIRGAGTLLSTASTLCMSVGKTERDLNDKIP